MALGRPPQGEGKSMRYYDPKRSGPVDGIRISSEIVAFLSEVTSNQEQGIKLSPEGSAGLSLLLTMIHQCLADVVGQLRNDYPRDSE